MRWQVLKNGSPHYGSKCVVAHYVGQGKKPIAGVWEYFNTYWYARDGRRIDTNVNDRWCYVSDIVSSIENRLTDEMIDCLKEYRRDLW